MIWRYFVSILVLCVVSACANVPTKITPPSLATIPANYYHRNLIYQQHYYRHNRVYTRTVIIPVTVNHETGDIKTENKAEEPLNRAETEQLSILQWRVNRLHDIINQHKLDFN